VHIELALFGKSSDRSYFGSNGTTKSAILVIGRQDRSHHGYRIFLQEIDIPSTVIRHDPEVLI
jgi:hypothetical protein